MLLQEMGWNKAGVEIVGVDLSNQVLERARKGRYVQFEVNRGLSPSMLGKYFTPIGTEWQLKDQIRDMVRFEQLDLRRDLRGLGMFDLVLCRNVLIYFDAATKKKILYSIANILEPGGALVLGCAETILNIHPGLKRCAAGQSTFYMLS
jgi:chemotaxis protein methyltransferase CheR